MASSKTAIIKNGLRGGHALGGAARARQDQKSPSKGARGGGGGAAALKMAPRGVSIYPHSCCVMYHVSYIRVHHSESLPGSSQTSDDLHHQRCPLCPLFQEGPRAIIT